MARIERCRLDLQKDPSNPQLHVRLGDLYIERHLDIYNSGLFIDDAITEYQLAMESLLDSHEIYYKLGTAFFFKGDLDKAVHYLTTAIEKKNNYYEAYYMMAEVFVKKGHFTDAIDAAQAAIQCSSIAASSAHFLLYKLYDASSFKNSKLRLKAWCEKIMAFFTLPFDKLAIKSVLTSLSYTVFLFTFIKGFYVIQLKDFAAAIQLYKQAIEKAPGFAPLYCVLGDIYLTTGYFEDAITEYKMAIWLDPFNIPAYKHLCNAYEEQGNYNQAIEIYNKLISMAPTMPDLYSNLANIYYIKGEFDLAISHYQTAITLNPNRSWTSIIAQTMGFVYQENKSNPEAAISAYQTAYVLTPEDIDYINAHGTSTHVGDIAESNAIAKVFGDLSVNKDLKVSSTKSMHGHMVGATGGAEAIVCIKAINESIIPPTINLENQDPEVANLNYVPNKAIEKEVTYALTNSFGFGGQNASLLFKKLRPVLYEKII